MATAAGLAGWSAGCGYGAVGAVLTVMATDGSSSGGGEDVLVVNANARAEILELPREADTINQLAPVPIRLIDPEGDPVQIELTYREGQDPSAPFLPASIVRITQDAGGPDEKVVQESPTSTPFSVSVPLETADEPDGVIYRLDWSWPNDLGNDPRTDVSFRVSIVGAGGPGGGVAFTSDGLKLGNDAPEVTALQVSGSGGVVVVSGLVSDSTGDLVDLEASFQLFGATSTQPIVPVDPSALENLQAASSTREFFFLWDTAQDPILGQAAGALVRVLVRGTDEGGRSGAEASSPFVTIDNDEPVEVLAVSGRRAPAAPVEVRFTLADADPGDLATVEALYSFVDGVSPTGAASGTATLVDGTGAALAPDALTDLVASPTGTEHVFLWDFEQDLGDLDPRLVTLTIRPAGLGAVARTSAAFGVGNAAPALALVTTFAAEEGGSIPIAFSILDSLGDRVRLTAQYDPGTGFLAASTAASITEGLLTREDDGSAVEHLFVWNSAANLPDAEAQNVPFRLTVTEEQAGGLHQTLDFAITVTNVIDENGTSTPALAIESVTPTAGGIQGGTLVTVVGRGFQAFSPSVRVDGASVSRTILSDTRLVFTAPPHAAGPVTITLDGIGSTVDSLPNGFTYLPVVSFLGSETASADEASAPLDIEVVVEAGEGGSLSAQVTVDVIDVGLGTAISGVDYTLAPRTTVTFPAGTLSGTVTTVRAFVIQDDLLEEPEFTTLRLDSLTGPALLGALDEQRLVITDDELFVRSFRPESPRLALNRNRGDPQHTFFFRVQGPSTTIATLLPEGFDVTRLGQVDTDVFGTPGDPLPPGVEPIDARVLRLTTAPGDTAERAGLLDAQAMESAGAVSTEDVDAYRDGGLAVCGVYRGGLTLGRAGGVQVTLAGDPAGNDRGFVARYDAAGELAWARDLGGAIGDLDAEARLLGAAAMPDGGVAATGFFTGTVSAAPGVTLTATAVGSPDAIVARYDAAGDLVWTAQASGASATAIAPCVDGTLAVAGVYAGTALFGPGELAATTLTSAGLEDCFVARYGADGALCWARSAGGAEQDAIGGVAAFADGSVALGGTFRTEALFAGGNASTTLGAAAGAGDFDGFVARYDAAGTLLFARSLGGTGSDRVDGIAAMVDGGIAVAGSFDDTLPLGATTLIATGFAGLADLFVARLDAAGDPMWATQAGGPRAELAAGVDALADGSVVVCGVFSTVTSTEPSVFGRSEAFETALVSDTSFDDAFLARFAGADGTLTWAFRAGSSSSDDARAVATLEDGRVAMVGVVQSGAAFGEGEQAETVLSGGPGLGYLARYRPVTYGIATVRVSGAAWAQGNFGSNSARSRTDCIVEGVAALPDGGAISVGHQAGGDPNGIRFEGSIDTTLANRGGQDIFIVRYGPDGDTDLLRADGGPGDDVATGVAAYLDEGFALSGHVTGTATFGDGVAAIQVTAEGLEDAIIVRYEPSGQPRWVRSFGGTGSDRGLAVASFPDGGAALCGSFEGTATLGVTPLVAGGGKDLFFARFADDGDLLVLRGGSGGSGDEEALAIASFSDGGLVICGRYEGTDAAVPQDGTAVQALPAAVGGADLFVARYDAAGDLVWVQAAGGAGLDEAAGVAAFPDGEVVICGSFVDSITFAPGTSEQVTLTAASQNGLPRGFVARFDAAGVLRWARKVEGVDGNQALAAAAIATDQSVLVAGHFVDDATFFTELSTIRLDQGTATQQHMYYARFDAATGAALYAKQTFFSLSGSHSSARAVAAAPDGGALIAGFTRDAAGGSYSINLGAGETASAGVFVFTTNGAFQQAFTGRAYSYGD